MLLFLFVYPCKIAFVSDGPLNTPLASWCGLGDSLCPDAVTASISTTPIQIKPLGSDPSHLDVLSRVLFDTTVSMVQLISVEPAYRFSAAVEWVEVSTGSLLVYVEMIDHMQSHGFSFIGKIREFEAGRYIMAMAPDDILLELFEYFTDGSPEKIRRAFAV